MKAKTNNKKKQGVMNKAKSKKGESTTPKSVWLLVSEDISECEARHTIWSTMAEAKEAMEKEILKYKRWARGAELERESDVKVRLGNFWWTILERKIGAEVSAADECEEM